MVYSKYNIFLHNFPKEHYVTIYNLYTKELICIPEDLTLNGINKELAEKLNQKGMIVDFQQAEEQNVLRHFYEVQDSKNELSIVVLMTQKCNCHCIYCYEEGGILDGTDVIDIEKIYEFIVSYVMKWGYKKVNIVYYGGEPLLNKKMIFTLSEKLESKFEDNFCFDIVTNGTLLEADDVQRWTELGLRRIKVTIDGCETSHNLRRKLKNGENAYTLILNNLSKISGMVDILINIVVDDEVYGIEKMIDDLADRNIKAKFSISIREPDDYGSQKKADIILENTKILAKKGVYQYSKIGENHGIICSGKKNNCLTVDAQNNIYYCNGNFSFIAQLNENSMIKKDYFLDKNCKECKYLPICYGGCRFSHRCQKEYFELVVPELLRIYIKEK